MIVSITIFNDPSELGKGKGRKNLNFNYAFAIHNGVRAQVVAYKKNVRVRRGKGMIGPALSSKRVNVSGQMVIRARKAIPYFTRAIDKIVPQIPKMILEYLEIKVIDKERLAVDEKSLTGLWLRVGTAIQEEAMSIIEHEAKDTGDLMNSVKLSRVEIEP